MKAGQFSVRALRPRHHAISANLIQRRMWHDGEGNADNITPPTDTPAGQPGGQNTGGEPRFTQADLDRIVGERAVRAKNAGVEELLKTLGLSSAEELKTLVDSEKQRRDAESSELEKAQQKLAAAEKRAKEAEDKALAAEEQRRLDLRNAAIVAAARDARATHPDDVLVWATHFGAQHKADVKEALNDDGSVNEKHVKAIVEAAKKERPHFFGSTAPGSPSNRNGQPPSHNPAEVLKDKKLVRL